MGFRSFFSRLFASDDRSPWGSFWFEPVSARTGAGVVVTPDAAMRLSAVYACVRVLAETFAMLPFVLYRTQADGGREVVRDHWLFTLFAKRPNQYQTPFEFREMLQGHLALRGNAYCLIVSNYKGEITALIPLHPDRVKPDVSPDGVIRYIVQNPDGTTTPYSAGQIWHLRGLSSDGLRGLSPIDLARENLSVGMAAQGFAARYFANDAKPGSGWIEYPGKFANKEARLVFKEQVQEAHADKNRGRMMVMDQGMKYHEVGVTADDAQFLQTRKFQVSEVARLFRVPPHMIGDLDRATNNNIEQQSLDFIMHTMTPWAERWEASIECFLMLDEDSGLEIEFDFANLLRGDRASRSMFYHAGILDGWMTRNEARLAEGLNPLPGLDEPLRPLNMVEEKWAETEGVNPAKGVQPNGQAGRLQSLVHANAARLARRFSKAGTIDATLVSEALSIPSAVASEWASAWTGKQMRESEMFDSLVALGAADSAEV